MKMKRVLQGVTEALAAVLVLAILATTWGVPWVLLIELSGGGLHDNAAGFGAMLYSLWPAFVLLVMVLMSIDYISTREGQWRYPVTTMVSIFYFLPLIMNALSSFCQILGWKSGTLFFFEHRWASQPFFLVAVVAVGGFCGLLSDGWKRHKHHLVNRFRPSGPRLMA